MSFDESAQLAVYKMNSSAEDPDRPSWHSEPMIVWCQLSKAALHALHCAYQVRLKRNESNSTLMITKEIVSYLSKTP